LDSLAEELAGLLEWDLEILKAYTFLLTKNGEVMKDEVAEGLGVSDEEASRLLDLLDRDGLTVRGKEGVYPVHPRLGISNVYRLSTARSPSVQARRPKVDSVMAILTSYRDRVEDRQFAHPPSDPELGG
jgi:predicted ArsR family transcriptional regulator